MSARLAEQPDTSGHAADMSLLRRVPPDFHLCDEFRNAWFGFLAGRKGFAVHDLRLNVVPC